MTPRIVPVDMTLTWCKVKVKVTVLLQFQKIAVSQVSPLSLWHGVQNWWLTNSTGPSLQLVFTRYFEFPLQKAVTRVQTSRNVNITRISKRPYFRTAGGYCHMVGHACIAHTDVTLTWSMVKVKVTVTDLKFWKPLFYIYLLRYFAVALTTDGWLG